MSTENNSSIAQPANTGGGIFRFLEGTLSLILCFLMAAGIVALTANWRSSTIEFVGSDQVRVTQSEWWGLSSSESLYRAGSDGWVIIRDNGDVVSVATQPIKIKG